MSHQGARQTSPARHATTQGARSFVPMLSKLFGLLAVISLCLAAPLALAQGATRNLSGMISDHRHEPLKGAVVQVENQGTHSVVSYITTESGKYSFKRLQGDTDYSVWVTFRGQRSREKTLSTFDTHVNPVIDFVVALP